MGSPISVCFAELTMQSIQNMLRDSPYPIIFWRRYVDDCLAILQKDHVHAFMDYINSINSHFVVTCEQEKRNQLPYMDLLITRRQDGLLNFSIHRKPTNTGKLLDFKSNNPQCHKRSVASSLVDRAYGICSPNLLEEVIKTITDMLLDNGYPSYMIQQQIRKREQ